MPLRRVVPNRSARDRCMHCTDANQQRAEELREDSTDSITNPPSPPTIALFKEPKQINDDTKIRI